jgi:hypothetical protein
MTSTGSDGAALIESLTDDDLRLLAGRLREWEQAAYPMQDVSGAPVPLAGPTGRVQVSPGQTIQSQWGNTVWDQSIQCFANNGDRDTQYTAPHEGAMCFTNDLKILWVYRNGAWVEASAQIVSRVFNQMSGNWPTGANGLLIPNVAGYWSYVGSTQQFTFLRAGLYLMSFGIMIGNTNAGSYLNTYLNPIANNVQNITVGVGVGGAIRIAATWSIVAAANATATVVCNNAGAGSGISQTGTISYLGPVL